MWIWLVNDTTTIYCQYLNMLLCLHCWQSQQLNPPWCRLLSYNRGEMISCCLFNLTCLTAFTAVANHLKDNQSIIIKSFLGYLT